MADSPPDRFKLVFFIFMLHGLGTLMPWNMFITAKSYFVDLKLNSPQTIDEATNFMQYMTLASQIPNIIFNWLNIFVHFGGDLSKRIVYSIMVIIILFILTIVLAMMNTSDWPVQFFWLTIATVVLLNMANGIYQNTIYGLVATLPPKYTGNVVFGASLSGLLVTIISICSNSIFSSKRTAAIYYFITALIVLLLCFDTYFALPINRYFRYHDNLKKSEQSQGADSDGSTPYWTIFKQAFPQLFNVFLIFAVTLAVFPAIHSDIKPSSDDFVIAADNFTLITCFLTFNLFALLGNLTAAWIQWPKPKYLFIPVVIRLAFVPLFLFCNYRPRNLERHVSVLINNDYIYWIIAVLMSYSSGYLSSLAMMNAPGQVPPPYQSTAGMFAAAMLITGIFTGILLSLCFPYIVCS